jgi:hypothetical protein
MPPYDRVHAGSLSVTGLAGRFAELLGLVSPPYAAKIEKNSLFYFSQACYPIYSKTVLHPVISPKF